MNKGVLLVLSTAIISGFAIFISKFGVSVISPYIFTGLKNLTVAIILCCLLWAMKDLQILKKLKRNHWGLLLIIGLIGGSIPFLLFFKGLSITTGVQGAFIHKTMFIYVTILAFVFLKEKINKKLVIGGLFLLLGNVFLLKFIPHQIGKGDFLILLATLFWAVENTISKYTLRELAPRIVMWGRMFFGSIFILVFLVITGQFQLVSTLNLAQIGWVVATAVILLGYVMTWYTGLKYVPVSVAAPILLLGLPITTLLSLVFLGIFPAPNQILGIILAISGTVFIIGTNHIKKMIKKLVYVGN